MSRILPVWPNNFLSTLAHLMHLTRNCTLALTPPGLLLYSHRPRRRTSQQQRRQHPRPQPQLHGHPRQSSWWMLLPRAVKSKYGSGGLGAEGFALFRSMPAAPTVPASPSAVPSTSWQPNHCLVAIAVVASKIGPKCNGCDHNHYLKLRIQPFPYRVGML